MSCLMVVSARHCCQLPPKHSEHEHSHIIQSTHLQRAGAASSLHTFVLYYGREGDEFLQTSDLVLSVY